MMIFTLFPIYEYYTVSGVGSSRRARMFYAADESILGSTLSLFNYEVVGAVYLHSSSRIG
jgi:hypothetical protein